MYFHYQYKKLWFFILFNDLIFFIISPKKLLENSIWALLEALKDRNGSPSCFSSVAFFSMDIDGRGSSTRRFTKKLFAYFQIFLFALFNHTHFLSVKMFLYQYYHFLRILTSSFHFLLSFVRFSMNQVKLK